MTTTASDSVVRVEDAAEFTPDTNDPTAGRVSISRELASEQAV